MLLYVYFMYRTLFHSAKLCIITHMLVLVHICIDSKNGNLNINIIYIPYTLKHMHTLMHSYTNIQM